MIEKNKYNNLSKLNAANEHSITHGIDRITCM